MKYHLYVLLTLCAWFTKPLQTFFVNRHINIKAIFKKLNKKQEKHIKFRDMLYILITNNLLIT